jgi:type IV secretion system protein VirB11
MDAPDQQAGSFLATYLKPLATALTATDVVEIAVNSDGQVWFETQGAVHMRRFGDITLSQAQARDLAGAIAGATQGQISEKKPLITGKILYEGKPIRAQVVYAPVIEGGPSITLRRYSEASPALAKIALLHGDQIDLEALRRDRARNVLALTKTGDIERAMKHCVDDRLNIMVSGGTSTGKTTFVRALLAMVAADERLVTIEDAYELFPLHQNKVMLKADRMDKSERTASKLLEATLRMRPDRIILGELRGEECKTFLDAINTGHAGSFTTIHADTARKALDRLALMVMSVGMNMSFAEVQRYCAASIDVVVQLGRAEGRRGIAQIYLPGEEALAD